MYCAINVRALLPKINFSRPYKETVGKLKAQAKPTFLTAMYVATIHTFIIMSLRTSFRGLASSFRSLSTSSRLRNAPTSTSTEASGHGTEFDDLMNMVNEAPPTSSFGSESGPSTIALNAAPVIIDPTAVRGYDAHSIPPDVDPLLELFTNMLMKHGRKAEAEGRVSRILSLL